MKSVDYKITEVLFRHDIRDNHFKNEFENVFKIKLKDLLEDAEYDELDEYPFEIENKGILIGFIAETIKVPPQLEYIDFDISNYDENVNYLDRKIPFTVDSYDLEYLEKCLNPCHNIRVFRSLYNLNQANRIIFQDGNLRFELSISENNRVSRIRICYNNPKSNVNMRTYYNFGE